MKSYVRLPAVFSTGSCNLASSSSGGSSSAKRPAFPRSVRRSTTSGWAARTDNLSTALSGLAQRGQLEIEEPRLAAEHFIWLVLSIPLNRAMLLGDDHGIGANDLDRYADAGVDTFLHAHKAGLPNNLDINAATSRGEVP